MFHVILFQPEIPPNTGNVIRLCANSGATLHLIEPLGFSLDEKAVRRAGMDYAELADVRTWSSLGQCFSDMAFQRYFAISTRGATRYDSVVYQPGDAFLFGRETSGLPPDILQSCPAPHRLRIPMQASNRSLNLSNSVAVVVYEAWRQQNFAQTE